MKREIKDEGNNLGGNALKKKIEVSPIFFVPEPSQNVRHSHDGGGSTGFDLPKHLSDGKGWKFNALVHTQGATFKKILFSAALVFPGKTKWVLPKPLCHLLLENGIEEIYGLDNKTEKPVTYHLKDFKNFTDYWVLETNTIHSIEPESVILPRLAKSENLNNWLIIDSDNFLGLKFGLIENLILDKEQSNYINLSDLVKEKISGQCHYQYLESYSAENFKYISLSGTDDNSLTRQFLQNCTNLRGFSLKEMPTQDILSSVPEHIKILNINNSSVPIDFAAIFLRFHTLEKISIVNSQIENIPDLSKTCLQSILLSNSNFGAPPKLPKGCFLSIKNLPNKPKIEENNVVVHESTHQQQVFHPHKIIDSITYVSPDTEILCPIQLFFAKSGNLIEGDIPHLRTLRQDIHDSVIMIDGQINLSTEDHRIIQSLDNKIDISESISLADLKSMTDTQYYLSLPCSMDEEGWMPIPLRYANDGIIRLAVNSAKIEKIVYSERTQRYFIKFQIPVALEANIEYIVEEKCLPINSKIYFPVIPEQAKQCINKFINEQLQISQVDQSFEEILKSLKLIQDNPDKMPKRELIKKLQKYLENFKNESLTGENENTIFQIFKQQKGACRHRSFLFVILCQFVGIPAREYSNFLHAAAEIIDEQGNVCTYDFDGAKVDIKLTHRNPLLLQATRQEAKISATAEKYGLLLSPYLAFPESKTLDYLIKKIIALPKLFIKVNSIEESRGLYQSIYHHADQRPVYYVESYEQLFQGLNALNVSNGKITRAPGPLTRVLQAGGILIIDWQKFSQNEMLKCASLLDNPPKFGQHRVHKNLAVIGLISDEKIKTCQALTRRARHLIWPSNIARPQFSITVSDDEKDLVEIDLFNNVSHWDAESKGKICFTNEGPVFKPGALTEALLSGKNNIIFRDPPVKDSDFQYAATVWQVQKQGMVNGELTTLPEHLQWKWCQNTIHETKVSSKINFLDPLKTRFFPLSLRNDLDIFYLSRANFCQLTEDYYIDKSHGYQTTGGWLNQITSRQKYLVTIEPLNKDQERELFHHIEKAELSKINYLDLTKVPENQVVCSGLFLFAKGANIIETEDPDFIAKYYLSTINPKPLYHLIDKGMGAELFASATCDIDQENMGCRFHSHISEISLALMRGETVILKGELSIYAYAAMQNLFRQYAQIKLPHSTEPQSLPGRLIIVTPKLKYPTLVADQTGRRKTLSTLQLWEQYEKILLKSHDEQTTVYKNFLKLRELVIFISSLPHNGLDTPPNADFTYDQVEKSLKILENGDSQRDNPIKSVFLNRYEKSSEMYALINVICKLLFSTKTEGGIRYEKLQKYPDDLSYLWRRLNCLSAVELRKFFQYDSLKFTLNGFNHYPEEIKIKFSEYPKENLNHIKKNKKHRNKICQRVTDDLNNHHAVLLLGPPGSGKTHLMNKIASQRGACFFGSANLKKWAESHSTDGSKLTAVFDEATLALHQEHLDQLMDAVSPSGKERGRSYQGIPLTDAHEICFTGNPFSFSGRRRHPLWNKISVDYLKKWSDPELKKIIIAPTCAQAAQNLKDCKLLVTEEHQKNILNIYHLALEYLKEDQVSNRNLIQLIQRWFFYCDKFKTVNANQALIEAAYQEFSGLIPLEEHGKFNARLLKLLKISEYENFFAEDYKKFAQKFENVQWKNEPFLISSSRIEILYRLNEQLELRQFSSEAKPAILIEGPSAKGKSSLACCLLQQLGYQQFDDPESLLDSKAEDLRHTFVEVTLTEEMILNPAWLLKAFDLGCTVVLNESNSQVNFPLLNDLLTGVTPDGRAPTHPGFCLIALQNPASDGGRFALSSDLINRFHVIPAPDDTREELLEMAKQSLSSNTQEKPEEIVAGFLHQKKCAPHLCTTDNFFTLIKSYRKTPTECNGTPIQINSGVGIHR